MIPFDYLLRDFDIDLARARLVRHQSSSTPSGKTPYDFWAANDGSLELYQRIQNRPLFPDPGWVISFVTTPLDETLFVGIYQVSGVEEGPPGTIDPSSGLDRVGCYLYDLNLTDDLAEYRGRIVIDWGRGYRTWVQRADRNAKPILEIRREASEPPFPGFSSFKWRIAELSAIPSSWRTLLSNVSGVYLLVSLSTGRQYVGSASGAGGFWQRWQDYFRTGHGGNEGMKLAPDDDYQVSVLEIASTFASEAEIVQMEAAWKKKLLSRQFGYNKN